MISPEIRLRAAEWAVELLSTSEPTTAQRWNQFEEWIAQSPQHREAYVRSERAWRASSAAQKSQAVLRLRAIRRWWSTLTRRA